MTHLDVTPAIQTQLVARVIIRQTIKPRITVLLILLNLLFCLSGCEKPTVPASSKAEQYPAGSGSVSTKPFPRFDLPLTNLPHSERPNFHAGKALAHQPWITAPTITNARDGLGPLFNARTCLSCHVKGGKGLISQNNEIPLSSALVRLSIPGQHQQKGVQIEPVYGDQFQNQSISLAHLLRNTRPAKEQSKEPSKEPGKEHSKEQSYDVKPEASLYLRWSSHTFTYPDQSKIELRSPTLDIRQLNYGALHKDTQFSLRSAPAIHGMGLLEAIDQQDINALQDPEDNNNDGISGRVNMVWDPTTKTTQPGRFSLKANQPNLHTTVAAAFANDIGITNPLFPGQPCTKSQVTCLQKTNGNDADGFELPQHLLDLTVNFSRNLGVPKRSKTKHLNTQKGRTLFYQTGCSSCHNPRFVTKKEAALPHLSNQTIWPYTDLLLHDMGEGLADGRADFSATGSEWRTAPLWGAGLHKAVNGNSQFLHDGRARSIEEAILWHGGEAEKAKQAFVSMDSTERLELLQFVESL